MKQRSNILQKPIDKTRPTLVVSACLMGESVRWNATAATCRWIVDELSKFTNIITICPEMMMGLGVPRPTIRLGRLIPEDDQNLLVETKTGMDHTDLANKTIDKVIEKGRNAEGFILKAKSPSCGIEKVKLYNLSSGHSIDHKQKGIFAASLMENYPDAGYVDEGRLVNPLLREHFVIVVFALFNLKNIDRKISALQKFHAQYKYLLMAFAPSDLKKLGNICADHNGKSFEEVYDSYYEIFSSALRKPFNVGRVYNTLVHIYGYFKKVISEKDKKHIMALLDDYHKGQIPMTVPLELLHFLAQKYELNYLLDQKIFTPYPKELGLRRFI